MRMSLSAKGGFAPPPALDPPLQELSEQIQSWPEIVAATHWHFSGNGQVDGADFYRGEEEVGHIHLEGEVHVVSTPKLAAAMIALGLARRSPWLAEDWVVFRIRTRADVLRAERLMRLSYDHLGGLPEAELVSSLTQRSLEQANSGADLNHAVIPAADLARALYDDEHLRRVAHQVRPAANRGLDEVNEPVDRVAAAVDQRQPEIRIAERRP